MGEPGRRPLTLLIVGDDPEGAGRVGALLDGSRLREATRERAADLAEARERLERPGVDVVLLRMRSGALPAVEELHGGHPATLGAPLIVLADDADNGCVEGLLAAGAQECLSLRGLDGADLERAIRHATERHRLLAELRELALVDELTGLNNRRAFFATGGQMLRMAERSGDGLAIFFFDLDNLKYINDTGGHAAGDRQLADLADIFRATFRTSDLIARLGGDEFAVLAVAPGAEDAQTLLDRFREAVECYNADSSHLHGVSVSAGFARFDPAAPRSLDCLLEEADRAMYREKWTKKAAHDACAAQGEDGN